MRKEEKNNKEEEKDVEREKKKCEIGETNKHYNIMFNRNRVSLVASFQTQIPCLVGLEINIILKTHCCTTTLEPLSKLPAEKCSH